jgi:hypothetical protein
MTPELQSGAAGRAVILLQRRSLLELSEIAFNESRTLAVMSYSFSCGFTCGHGGVLVFEKTAQGWKRANRSCSTWMA